MQKTTKRKRVTLTEIVQSVERERSENTSRFRRIEGEIQSVKDEWQMFRQDVSSQLSGMREWLMGWTGRQEVGQRKLERGHEAINEKLDRMLEAVGAKGDGA